jgi:hypothetical protein
MDDCNGVNPPRGKNGTYALTEVVEAVEQVCHEQHGRTLRQMATAVITDYLHANMKVAKTSSALYLGELRRRRGEDRATEKALDFTRRSRKCWGQLPTRSGPIRNWLRPCCWHRWAELFGYFWSRVILSSKLDTLREELIFAACAYLGGLSYSGFDSAS